MVLRLEAEELTQYNEDLDADRKRDLLSALVAGLDAALPFLHQARAARRHPTEPCSPLVVPQRWGFSAMPLVLRWPMGSGWLRLQVLGFPGHLATICLLTTCRLGFFEAAKW